jgi:hypothetical protein
VAPRATHPSPLVPLPPPGGIQLVGAKDSIFNSESFDKNVIDLEFAIRQRSGLKDKNQLRAAVYAAIMAIARAQNRTPKEQAVMDWLAGQVKKTRIDAARLALEEYDRWKNDPWSYHPPQGYDFSPYQLIAPPNSPQWLLSTPNPPMLAYPTLESYFRDLAIKTVAGGASGWSPLSGTFMKLKKKGTREGAVGFPTYGAVLAYQKLYNTDEGIRSLACATEVLITTKFQLSPLAGAPEVYRHLNNFRILAADQVALPLSQSLEAYRALFLEKLMYGVPGNKFSQEFLDFMLPKLRAGALRGGSADEMVRHALDLYVSDAKVVLRRMAPSAAISLVCTLVLTIALEALLTEITSISTKEKLREKLVDNLAIQKAVSLPNLGNLLHSDITGERFLYDDTWEPKDQAELERVIGSEEVYRAFLLSTV